MPADAQLERELEAIDAALEGRPVPADLSDWADLALALQDERPEIDPSFAQRLDNRAAAGFPRPEKRRRWRVLVALVVAVPLLSGGGDEELAGGGVAATESFDEQSGAGSAAPTEPAADSALQRNSGPSPAGDAGGGGSLPDMSVPPVPGPGSPRSDNRQSRKVETSASMTLRARPDEIERVADEIVRVTDRFRGFVVTSSVTASIDGGGGSFELRVPSQSLKTVIAELSKLAHVAERREATLDITREFVSASDRLEEARADRRGLLRRLERAAADAERDEIRAQLRIVNSRIATAKADLARVNNRASYSTISVTLTADPDAAGAEDDGSWSPGDAAKDAWRVLQVIAGGALIALAILVPLAILIALAVLANRLIGRRRRERLLDAV
jgi:hypothetical protein